MTRKLALAIAAVSLGTTFLASVSAFAHGSFGHSAGHSSMGMSHGGSAPSMGHIGHTTPMSHGVGQQVFHRPDHPPFGHDRDRPFWDRDHDRYSFWHHDRGRLFGYGGVYAGTDSGAVGYVGGSYQPSGNFGSAGAPAAPCNCLTKQYLQDGSVLFQDNCTKEAAIMPPAQQANGPAPTAR
jgi:hypothetical protein